MRERKAAAFLRVAQRRASRLVTRRQSVDVARNTHSVATPHHHRVGRLPSAARTASGGIAGGGELLGGKLSGIPCIARTLGRPGRGRTEHVPDDGAQCSSEGKGEQGEEVAAVITPLLSRVKSRRLALSERLGTTRRRGELPPWPQCVCGSLVGLFLYAPGRCNVEDVGESDDREVRGEVFARLARPCGIWSDSPHLRIQPALPGAESFAAQFGSWPVWPAPLRGTGGFFGQQLLPSLLHSVGPVVACCE